MAIVQIKQNRFENTILEEFKIMDLTGGTVSYVSQDIYKYLNNKTIQVNNTIVKLTPSQRQTLFNNFNLTGVNFYRLDNHIIDLETYVGLTMNSYNELLSLIAYFSITDDVYTTLST
jgi:DNA replication protein DnaD